MHLTPREKFGMCLVFAGITLIVGGVGVLLVPAKSTVLPYFTTTGTSWVFSRDGQAMAAWMIWVGVAMLIIAGITRER